MQVNVTKRQHLSGHRAPVYALCAGTGKTFFSAGGDGLVVRWHYGSDKNESENVAQLEGKIFSLLFHEASGLMLAGTMEGDVFVFDPVSHRVVNKLHFGDLPVFEIVRMPGIEGYAILTGSGFVHMLSETFEAIGKIELSKSSLRSFAWHPDNRRFAISSSDHKIYLNADPVHEDWRVIEGPKHSVFSVTYDRLGKYLIAGSRDAQMYVYDIENDYALVETIQAHLFTVNNLVSASSIDIVFSAGRDKHIKVWDSESWKLLKVIDSEKLDGHRHSVNKLLWLEADNLLISAGDDKAVMLWNIDAA